MKFFDSLHKKVRSGYLPMYQNLSSQGAGAFLWDPRAPVPDPTINERLEPESLNRKEQGLPNTVWSFSLLLPRPCPDNLFGSPGSAETSISQHISLLRNFYSLNLTFLFSDCSSWLVLQWPHVRMAGGQQPAHAASSLVFISGNLDVFFFLSDVWGVIRDRQGDQTIITSQSWATELLILEWVKLFYMLFPVLCSH